MAEANRGPYTGKWFDERNRRRKQKYRTDREHRENLNKTARANYRDTSGAAAPFDPRINSHMLDPNSASFVGHLRSLEHAPDAGTVITFTKAELAIIFDRPVKQVQQWAHDGRIPSALMRGRRAGIERTWIDVYTLHEATALVDTLGPFLADLIYFRLDHKEAIEAVSKAVNAVRTNYK